MTPEPTRTPTFEELQRAWAASPALSRSPQAVARDVAVRLRWALRKSVLATAGEVVLTGVAIVALTRALPRIAQDATVWYVLAFLHSGVVWALVLWSRLALWAPQVDSTHVVLKRLERRAARQVVESRWLQRLLAVEAVAFFGWLIVPLARGERWSGGGGLPRALALAVPVALFLALWIWLWDYRRRAVRDGRWVSERLREEGIAE